MLHAALWKALSLISIAHISTVVRCACLACFIGELQVLRLLNLRKLLTGFFVLTRAFPVAISLRASAKKSNTLPGTASAGRGLGLFVLVRVAFGSFAASNFGQGAPGTRVVFGVDCSRPFVDDVFFDDVERLFKLSDGADVELGIMNFHC